MVYPNSDCALFCDWLLNVSEYRWSGPRLAIVTAVNTAAIGSASVTDNVWRNFNMITSPLYARYLQWVDLINQVKTIDFFICAGGGGGGSDGGRGGGGGGGQCLQMLAVPLSEGSYPVIIGAGGVAGISNAVASGQGGVSSFLTHILTGGGRGGGLSGTINSSINGGAGANGGGGAAYYPGIGGVGSSAFYGGNGVLNQYGAGGGAGAGGNGANAVATAGGAGGTGVTCNFTGVVLYYGSGGGGGGTGSGGAGGNGVGGSGGNPNPTNPTPNRGAGGGGGSNGTAGSAGIAYVRYLTGSMSAEGGTITNVGAYTLHTFTSSDNFVRYS